MTTRRAIQLTGDAVARLPAPCRECLFWELSGPCPEPRTVPALGSEHAAPPSEPEVRKQAWVSARVQEGTPPGRLLQVGDDTAGYVLFGPAEQFAPRRWPVPPVSEGALLLATAWVEPVYREGGLGRLLVQAALREAVRLGRPAVEAYGDRRWQERACVLPATWLLHEGFEVHREHPRTPVLRIDTRRTRRWAESLEHALDELLERMPRRVPVGERRGLPVPDGATTPGAGPGRRPDAIRR